MSMTPASWKITCSAWECDPESLHRPFSAPLVVEGATRAVAVRAARRAGWVPTDLLISGGNATDTWWCAVHVARSRSLLSAVTDMDRREVLLERHARADRARAAATSRRVS